jgi:hypothetical protein
MILNNKKWFNIVITIIDEKTLDFENDDKIADETNY